MHWIRSVPCSVRAEVCRCVRDVRYDDAVSQDDLDSRRAWRDLLLLRWRGLSWAWRYESCEDSVSFGFQAFGGAAYDIHRLYIFRRLARGERAYLLFEFFKPLPVLLRESRF